MAQHLQLYYYATEHTQKLRNINYHLNYHPFLPGMNNEFKSDLIVEAL